MISTAAATSGVSSSSSITTLAGGSINSNAPSQPSPRTEASVRAERKELRRQITNLAKKASGNTPLPFTEEECDQWLDQLIEYDEFLQDEDESPHYTKLGLIRAHIQKCSAEMSAAFSSGYNLHSTTRNSLPVFGLSMSQSTSGQISSSSSTTFPSSTTAASNTFVTWSSAIPQTAGRVPFSSISTAHVSSPSLMDNFEGIRFPLASSSASTLRNQAQPFNTSFPSQQYQSGFFNQSSSTRRYPTTVKRDDVPKFDGRPSSWARFKERFTSSIGRNPNLDEIEKIEFLAVAIPDCARTVLTYRTYEQALNDLELEIADPDEVVNDLYRIVNDVKLVPKRATLAHWKDFREEVKNITRLTEASDRSLKTQLHSILMRKLGDHRLDYVEKAGGRSLEDMNTYVGLQMSKHRVVESNDTAAQATTSMSSLSITPHPRNARFINQHRNNSHVHSINVQSTPSPCFFCDGAHLRKMCPLNMQQRVDGLRQRGRCFRCLALRSDPSHPSNCQATCEHCRNSYHKFVCRCGQRRSPLRNPPPVNTPPIVPLSTTTPNTSTSQSTAEGNSNANPVYHLTIQQKGVKTEEPIVISPTDVIYLPTVRVHATNLEDQRSTEVRVFGDAGSMTTFVSEQLVTSLGITKRCVRPFKATVFGGGYTCSIDAKARIRIRSINDDSVYNDIDAYVMKGTLVMPLPLPSDELRQVARARGIQLSECSTEENCSAVDILLGEDWMESVFYEEGMSRIKPNLSLSFEETRYGWILRGHTGKAKEKYVNCAYVEMNEEEDELEGLPRLFGVYHACGPIFDAPLLPAPSVFPSKSPDPCKGLCKNLELVLADPLSNDGKSKDQVGNEWRSAYDATLKYDESTKRYTAGLPWLSDKRPEPNLSAARGFAYHMRNSLREKGQFRAYTDALMEFVRNDYARELPYPYPEDGYYLLHFPVLKVGSTTPIRPVFNASSAAKGQTSLNLALCKGHWDQTQLVHEVIHFRMEPYVLLGDIKQAFLQIKINPDDQKFTRFLWFDDKDRLRAYEMTSLLFGAVSSPFILHAVICDLFKRQAPELSHVVDDTYMDDCLLYADSIEQLGAKKDKVSEVMARASFTLHKWLTTPEVAQALDIPITKEEGACLGVKWRLKDDVIIFKVPQKECQQQLSRRTLLSYFSTIFDPLGLLGPFHTAVKLMMKEVLAKYPTWDEPINADDAKPALALFRDVQEYLPRTKFKRLVRTSTQLELWIFGDASKHAYGICVYVHDRDTGQTELLLSRGHIPSQNKTIPELELVAATLAVDTYVKIKDSLSFDPVQVLFFTDSQVTWHRIQSDSNKFPAFVMNRVRRIQNNSSPEDWFFIPGTLNPADLVSRGTLIRHLHASDLWMHGPPRSAVEDAKQQTTTLHSQPVQVNAVSLAANESYITTLINNLSYSKLRASLSVLLKFTDQRTKMLRAYQQHYGNDVDLDLLTDILLWRMIQKTILPDEWHAMHSGGPIPPGSSFTKVPIVLDRFGLLRLQRRLTNSNLPDEVKRPLVLTDHFVVRSYIKYIHDCHASHAGVRTTKEYFRRFVYLPNCDRIVEQVVRLCLHCLRYRTARPYSAPMAPLPEDRVSVGFAFQCIGVDLFGPLHAANGKVLKYYGMIFACAKSRAIHLELIESRSTENILRAYLRFVGIYGEPKLVRSDNELGFIKLNKTIKSNYDVFRKAMEKMRDHNKGRNTAWIDANTPADSNHRTRWIFNVPDAPNWGGFYERLIQCVKRALDKCRLLYADSFEKIISLLREVQLVVNSRPLVVSEEKDSILTPAHLVFGRGLQNPVPVKYPMSERDDTLISYTRLQHELERFWKVWEEDYLITLRNYRWNKSVEPRHNELVIIRKDGVPRYAWEMGRLTKLIRGKDNHIRAVQVELISGGTRNRQIQNIYPLEHPVGLGEDVAKPAQRQPSTLTADADDAERHRERALTVPKVLD